MAEETAASLNPETFTEGGGLIDDVDVTFTACAFEMFDYNGTVVPGVPSLKATLDMDGEEIDQFWSMGAAKDWLPSDDGSYLMAVGAASGIRASSNGGIFLKSLIDAGFPPEKLGDDISILNGMEAHLIRVPAPKRPGLKKQPREDGREYEATVLTVSEITAFGWERKAKTKPKTAGKAVTKTKAATKAKAKAKTAEVSGDVSDKAVATVLEILEDAGTVTKKELPAKIFQALKDDPERNMVVKCVFDDEFLSGGPWEYDDGVLVSS